MPLTSVVRYLEHRLVELHPRAHLRCHAELILKGEEVSGRLGDYRLIPRQAPVFSAATGELVGWSAQLDAYSEQGRWTIPETLFVQAWDSEDAIFLDRFLRTLHALHHLSLGADRHGLLALDVHLRHVAALPERHGLVFESLLHRLGLRPEGIVLRLSGAALHRDPHVREAAFSFRERGFRLIAARPPLDETDWDLLRSLGISWASLDGEGLDSPERAAGVEGWSREGRERGVGVWLEGTEGAELFTRAWELGAELVEQRPVDNLLPERSDSDSQADRPVERAADVAEAS
jgi:EAL domain-containing protein (putative c-di-GMP-specific phosphodiesterase class I)